MSVHLKRNHEHERRPWRNGGGSTTELASSPPGADAGSDFAWRVSMADVASSGDFSRFPGVDRVITLVEGKSMTLYDGSQPTTLGRFEPYAFDGDADISCEVHGPCRDLNVMTRRGRASASVELVRIGSRTDVKPAPGRDILVVGLQGSPRVVGDGVVLRLERGDTLTSDEPLELDGGGRVAVVRISAPTGPSTDHGACECGTALGECAGCGAPRCQACDPYLSDDCRWAL
ncbi:MAG: HutD/Ves family protein [Nocardioides sp.]